MEFVDQLKAQIDIVRVIQDYIPLKKAGPTYKGLCPFHQEKTPSFNVHPSHQFYYCFGCHAGGDVLKFVMEIERLSFYEALKLLAERHGIPMPKRSEYADQDTRLRAAIHQMHEMAEEEFRSQLRSSQGSEARAYLAKRGVAPEMIEEFRLGYAGQTLAKIFERGGFTAEQMEVSGLVKRRPDGSFYDYFRNRLIFPIHNERGNVIGFGGRALKDEDQPKYLNSPETPIYKKSHVLYNLHRAKEGIRKSDRVVLVEGYMDAIGVYAAGVPEVIASCGTAFTSQQVQTIKRHTLNIAVSFDPDTAGAKAAEKSIQMLLAESMRIRIVQLDGGLDPDEFCKQRGAEAYARCVQEAKSYFYWLADRARSTNDMRTAEGRVAVFQFLLPAIQGISDKLERVAIANDVAGYLGVNTGLVLETFRKMAADRTQKIVPPPREAMRDVDRILISTLLSEPESRTALVPQLKLLSAIQHSAARRIYESLFALDAAGESVGFTQLHSRLEEKEQQLLSAALLSDAGGHSHEDVAACVALLRQSERNNDQAQLKARVKEAERVGNLAEALRLMQELHALEKS